MLASVDLSGFSLNDADNLRKAMGKKKPRSCRSSRAVRGGRRRQRLRRGDRAHDLGQHRQVRWVRLQQVPSAAYALITYQTAYLKAHHRTDFLAANFSCEMSGSDKIKDFIDDAKKAGIRTLMPSAAAEWEFLPEPVADGGEAIRFGFGAVKGTERAAIEAMYKARTKMLEDGKGSASR